MRSESRLLAAIDVENLIVIDTVDAVLVAKKDSGQKVKDIVSQMKTKNYEEATSHNMIYRPWGSYLSIAKGIGWQVKK